MNLSPQPGTPTASSRTEFTAEQAHFITKLDKPRFLEAFSIIDRHVPTALTGSAALLAHMSSTLRSTSSDPTLTERMIRVNDVDLVIRSPHPESALICMKNNLKDAGFSVTTMNPRSDNQYAQVTSGSLSIDLLPRNRFFGENIVNKSGMYTVSLNDLKSAYQRTAQMDAFTNEEENKRLAAENKLTLIARIETMNNGVNEDVIFSPATSRHSRSSNPAGPQPDSSSVRRTPLGDESSPVKPLRPKRIQF